MVEIEVLVFRFFMTSLLKVVYYHLFSFTVSSLPHLTRPDFRRLVMGVVPNASYALASFSLFVLRVAVHSAQLVSDRLVTALTVCIIHHGWRISLLFLYERVGDLFAAIDGRDDHKEGAAGDYKTQLAVSYVAFVI